ncbi:interleukin-11 [Ranitomeya imitator]|uniref:interleukin-11 n=1 Tax=Ranitomeya imitator TaxID=111125 RepID=UPI0037E7CA6D
MMNSVLSILIFINHAEKKYEIVDIHCEILVSKEVILGPESECGRESSEGLIEYDEVLIGMGSFPSPLSNPGSPPQFFSQAGSLCQIALAIMSVCEGIWSIPLMKPKPSDTKLEFDSVLNMAKHLLSDTKHLYNNFKIKYPYEGEHKLESLPVLSINAAELSTIQISAGLTKLSSELFIYQKHFDWLKKAAHVARHLDHEFTSIHNRIEKLVKKIDFLMTKMNIARASDPPLPQLPNTTTQWGVVQTGHAIFHHFHLFLDYTTRVVVLMKNKL